MLDKPKLYALFFKNDNIRHVHIVNCPEVCIFARKSSKEKSLCYNAINEDENKQHNYYEDCNNRELPVEI